MGIHKPTAGEIWFEGQRIDSLAPAARRAVRRSLQYAYQDPGASLDPRWKIGSSLHEPLVIHTRSRRGGARARAFAASCEAVGLPDTHLDLYPHEISGGQQRRVGLARILTLHPKVVILDEPTSGLDVSVQATVLSLFRGLRETFDLTYVLISHDLAVIRTMCSRVAVMYLGRIVESGPTEADLRSAAASLYPLAGRGHSQDRRRARDQGFLAAGRAARPGQPALRLPLSHALPQGHRFVRARGAGAQSRWRRVRSPVISRTEGELVVMAEATGKFEIGVDIGGTFTDVVCRDGTAAMRLREDPDDARATRAPASQARSDYMQREWGVSPRRDRPLRARHDGRHQRRARAQGRADRPDHHRGLQGRARDRPPDAARRCTISCCKPETPVFLAPGALRKEVRERVTATRRGARRRWTRARSCAAVDELVAEGVEAIAVCFLFSFLNPAHERRTREIIAERHPELMVSLSCEVDPAFREYERTCVTAFDAYIKPVVGRYLESMEQDLAGARRPDAACRSCSRAAASAPPRIARQRPVRLFLSGPAAGVIGGARGRPRRPAIDDLITVDIGGTSCDIALISRGKPLIRAEGEIDGYPVRVPMVDVNAIGAGGGSRSPGSTAPARCGSARTRRARSRVPPATAAAASEATVTDASVVLGYINPDYFAGGSLKLSPGPRAPDDRDDDRAAAGLSASSMPRSASIASSTPRWRRRSGSSRSAAASIRAATRCCRWAAAGRCMRRALARELGIRRIAVPPHPGVLSAAGLLVAPDRA